MWTSKSVSKSLDLLPFIGWGRLRYVGLGWFPTLFDFKCHVFVSEWRSDCRLGTCYLTTGRGVSNSTNDLRTNVVKENRSYGTGRFLFNVRMIFRFQSNFSFSFLVLVYIVLTTLIVWPLNFVNTNYTVPKMTYFVCRRFLSVRHICVSTFKILGVSLRSLTSVTLSLLLTETIRIITGSLSVDFSNSYIVVFVGVDFSFLFLFFCSIFLTPYWCFLHRMYISFMVYLSFFFPLLLS